MAPLVCVLPGRSKLNYLTVGMGYRWTTESHLSSSAQLMWGQSVWGGEQAMRQTITGHKFNGAASPRVAESLHVHSTQRDMSLGSMDKRQSGLCAEMPTQDYIHC